MNEIQIRPTVKFVRAGALLLFFVAVVAWGSWISVSEIPLWIPIAATALLVWPLIKWIPNRMNVTTITADRLHAESGVFSKATRTLMLARVQDVGVTQSMGQRIVGVGDIWIETAGISSRVVLSNVDAPQRVADALLDAVQKLNPNATLNPLA